MKHVITLETIIVILKYGIVPISCWPPPVGSSNSVIRRHNLRLFIGLINLPLVIGTSLYNIYLNRHDAIRIIKIMSEVTAMTSAMVKMIICKIEAPRLQVLIGTMEAFLKEANREEKELLQTYVDKCLMVHTIVFVSVIAGPLVFMAGPWITSQPFPGDVAYPFPVESFWVWALAFFSESICIIQVGCTVILDIFFGVLLWYAGARFQMLSATLRKATNDDDINRCVQQHQELIGYVDQLIITIRIIAVEVTGVAMLAVTIGGFILIGNTPLYELAKYIFFEIGAAMELFLLTWPADNLIEVSNGIGDAAYDCDWIGKSPAMIKNILIVIQRSRNPIKISVNGVLPVLSLEFYGSTMAATFSYLTTLRAMTAN